VHVEPWSSKRISEWTILQEHVKLHLDRKPAYWVLCYPNVVRDKMATENESILFNQNGFMMDDEVNYSNCLLLSYPLNWIIVILDVLIRSRESEYENSVPATLPTAQAQPREVGLFFQLWINVQCYIAFERSFQEKCNALYFILISLTVKQLLTFEIFENYEFPKSMSMTHTC